MSNAGLFDRGAIAASMGMRISAAISAGAAAATSAGATAATSAGAAAAIVGRRRRPAAGARTAGPAVLTTVPDTATGIGPTVARILGENSVVAIAAVAESSTKSYTAEISPRPVSS